jgi:sporulation-control protein spo0M
MYMGLLSRLGIGAATVEPALHAPRAVAGEAAPVRVTVSGGSDGQHADELAVRLVTEAATGSGGTRPVPLARRTLATDLSVAPETERTFTGDLAVPRWTPATREGTEVLLSATLAMDWSREPTGRTSIEVDTGPRLERALSALAELGIGVNRARPVVASEAAHGASAPAADREVPVVHRYDCSPHSGAYVGRIRRLTVVAAATPSSLTLHLTTDVDPDAVFVPVEAYERFTTVEVTGESTTTLRRRFERALGTGSTDAPSRGV